VVRPGQRCRKQPRGVREPAGVELAGKLMGLGDAFSPDPRWQLDTEEAAATDQRVAAAILAAVPAGALGVFDLGCCRGLGCDDVTTPHRFCGTRRREQTASRTGQELSRGVASCEERIPVGPYRSTPCQSPGRLGSVRWPGGWSRDLTKGLAPRRRSARPVCERSRRRWGLEEACALPTRLLALADVWTGSPPGVPAADRRHAAVRGGARDGLPTGRPGPG